MVIYYFISSYIFGGGAKGKLLYQLTKEEVLLASIDLVNSFKSGEVQSFLVPSHLGLTVFNLCKVCWYENSVVTTAAFFMFYLLHLELPTSRFNHGF